jgi:hypothetical protein
VAPLTPSNATVPSYGQWMCQSPYFGKTYVGKYYLKKVVLPECTSSEQVWMGACPSLQNPVAFFFDDPDGAYGPFLALEGFDLTLKGRRYGKIHRFGPANPESDYLQWQP